MRWLASLSLALGALVGAQTLVMAAEPGPEKDGQALFVEKCGGCHMQDGFGTRVLARRVPEGQEELEKREYLPVSLTTAVVRHGVGSMPQIRAAELSDEDLRMIATYLENRP